MKKVRKYKPYKRLNQYQKELLHKMYEEKMEQRKIARVLGVELGTVQYHLKKKLKEYSEIYE